MSNSGKVDWHSKRNKVGRLIATLSLSVPFFTLLDVVREVITFWKTNKEHIYIPNYRDGLFKIILPSEKEMALYL